MLQIEHQINEIKNNKEANSEGKIIALEQIILMLNRENILLKQILNISKDVETEQKIVKDTGMEIPVPQPSKGNMKALSKEQILDLERKYKSD